MPLLNDLLDFSDHPLMPPPSAQLFAEHLPTEWIQHCLTLSAHATVRRRRLPGDTVIWMVVQCTPLVHILTLQILTLQATLLEETEELFTGMEEPNLNIILLMAVCS